MTTPQEKLINDLIQENNEQRADLKAIKDALVKACSLVGLVDNEGNITEKTNIKTVVKKIINILSSFIMPKMPWESKEDVNTSFDFIGDLKPLVEKYKNL